MKKYIIISFVIFLFFVVAAPVFSELIDRGGGLIYDTELNITWLQDANYAATELTDARCDAIISAVGSIDGHTLVVSDFVKDGSEYTGQMTWWGAMAWADQLVFSGYDDWRLPDAHNQDGSGPGYGFDVTGSEMGHMFYNNLEGSALSFPGMDFIDGVTGETRFFHHLQSHRYWSYDTQGNERGWIFAFYKGLQGYDLKFFIDYAWAVRDGDVIPAPQYTIIDLGTLGGNRSDALSINNLGQVVGTAKDDNGISHPFLYSDGEMINLSIIGEFTGGMATDINDYGQIIGWASSEIVLFGFPPSDKHAFIYSDGAMIDPGVLRGENGIPSSINNNGLITGEYFFSGVTHSFIYSILENDMHDLGTLGGSHSYGYGINEAGQVVGAATTSNGETHAFLYTDGSMTDLGTAEGNLSQAYDINNYTQIVGYFSPVPSAGDSRHPFLYDGDTMIDLGTLGGNSAKATAINDAGQIVGWSITDNSETHAFINKSGIIHDLSDLIPQDSNWDFLIEAWDINNSGQIVGNGRVDLDGDGVFDEIHAFLLTPIHGDTDGDGIPDDEDACPSSDLSETVVIDGWDTGVENVLLADGCTISDLISECADEADNHGEFVSSVSQTTNTLKKEGVISGKDKGKIQKGAAKAAIP